MPLQMGLMPEGDFKSDFPGQVTVYTTDKEYNHFVQLAKSLDYVKRIKTDDEPTKEQTLENIKAGREEVKLFKKGKLKTTSAKHFLTEL